ncbi:hypothetical protein CDAR_204121 [Caerostris darwini]|uniref:Uncharacterized protein n=1 Tax=Caerostris darwini TaxID=1538125 RepID=A0AAV4QKL7_9ARAC|nr:hypothetical protein CDAR_204121 [Caerostris darwini]
MSQTKKNLPRAIFFFFFNPKSERKIALRKREEKKVLLRSVFVYVFASKTTALGRSMARPWGPTIAARGLGYVTDLEDGGEFAQGNYFFLLPKVREKDCIEKEREKKMFLCVLFLFMYSQVRPPLKERSIARPWGPTAAVRGLQKRQQLWFQFERAISNLFLVFQGYVSDQEDSGEFALGNYFFQSPRERLH